MEIPVYVFTGFLESGKTTLIQETMADSDFNAGEPTLILLCEEGECELDLAAFARGAENVTVRTVESLDELTPDTLLSWHRERPFRRMLVEYNGMWQIGELYARLPRNFLVCQEILTADCRTFSAYNANLRSLVVDKLTGCEMVVFNRVDAHTDKDALHKLVRGVSRAVNISYEWLDGTVEYDDVIDPLPFDTDAAVVTVEDRDFALFFRDITEEMEKYNGKTVRFRALIARDERLGDASFVAGRRIMTCCADDVAYNGFVCVGKEKIALTHGAWAMVEANIRIEEHPLYRHPGPVLHLVAASPSEPPEVDVATFY